MKESILAKILALKTASLSELQKEYEAVFDGKKAPSNNKMLLWRRIAYRIQEIEYGGSTRPESGEGRAQSQSRANNPSTGSGSSRAKPRDEVRRGIEHDPTVTAKQIAGWLNMSPPRICQILDLLLLCPTIQKDILLSKDKKLYALGEYSVREIVKEPLWFKQIEIWAALLKSS